MTLSTLIDRVRAATGPDREIDADVYEALGYQVKRRPVRHSSVHKSHATSVSWRYLDSGRWLAMEYFTASLDAVVALIEREMPGAEYEYELTNIYGIAQATVGLNFSAGTPPSERRKDGNVVLALLAAFLSAKQSEQP